MKKKLIPLLALMAGASIGHGALVLVNFGETAYTSDGTNTWQSFDLEVGTTTAFDPVVSAALFDTTNTATGLTLSVSSSNGAVGTVDGNGGSAQSAFDAPASGSVPSWFDTSSAAQRETFTLGTGTVWTYTFSGFNTTDTVNFDFAVGRSAKNPAAGPRGIDLGYLGTEDLLNAAETNDTVHYASTGSLTGSTSYSFTIQLDAGSPVFSSGVNAIGLDITPVPEPSTFALVAGLLGLGLVVRRRRR